MASSPAVLPIITPEAVVLDFERAGLASRAIAFAIDGLALVATAAVLMIVGAMALGGVIEGGAEAVLALFASLGTVVVWFCAFETLWRGRTPGKAAMGLRVVSADGTPVRFQQAFLRAAVGLVDFFLVPVGFVAVVTVLLSPRDQRLGDMAASTLVVRERSAGMFVAPAWFPTPPGWERYAASLDVAALDEATYGLVRSYLLRVNQLTGGARDHLAVRLANPVAMRMAHTPPSYVHPHVFLMCVASAWQRAHGGNPYDAPLDARQAQPAAVGTHAPTAGSLRPAPPQAPADRPARPAPPQAPADRPARPAPPPPPPQAAAPPPRDAAAPDPAAPTPPPPPPPPGPGPGGPASTSYD